MFPSANPVIFVIARMGSSRLPGKVLMRLADRTVLGFLLERMRRVTATGKIVIATSTDTLDDAIAAFAGDSGVALFRGSESDTVDRLYQAAKQQAADPVVRITADCPLLEAATVDAVIERICEGKADYVSTDLTPTFPNGMGCDALRFAALERIYDASRTMETDRAWERLSDPAWGLRRDTIDGPSGASHYRLTVDTAEDLDLVRRIADALYRQNPAFGLNDIVALLDAHPDWLRINRDVVQKTGPHAAGRAG